MAAGCGCNVCGPDNSRGLQCVDHVLRIHGTYAVGAMWPLPRTWTSVVHESAGSSFSCLCWFLIWAAGESISHTLGLG